MALTPRATSGSAVLAPSTGPRHDRLFDKPPRRAVDRWLADRRAAGGCGRAIRAPGRLGLPIASRAGRPGWPIDRVVALAWLSGADDDVLHIVRDGVPDAVRDDPLDAQGAAACRPRGDAGADGE